MKNNSDKKEEYKYLSNLEMETTRFRYTTFTAILSTSFVLPGLSALPTLVTRTDDLYISLIDARMSMSKMTFLLGFIFYLFAVFYYIWFHRYSHFYRKRLKELEKEMDWNIYRLRKRPMIKNMKFHFVWILYLIGGVYAIITVSFIGWKVFFFFLGGLIILYCFLLILSIFTKEEPLE